MQLHELMTQNVQGIDSNATLREAAEQMASLDIGALPVVEGDQAVGMITDRDITVRAVAQGLDPKATNVRGSMTAELEYAPSDASIEDALRIMQARQVRRLVVTDNEGHLQGIVSLGDLANHCQNKAASGDALSGVSETRPTS